MQDQKKCVVCSMPLVKDEDYPEGTDTSEDSCKASNRQLRSSKEWEDE